MFSTLLDDSQNKLFTFRLQKVMANLRTLTFSTREEYVAAMYSQINQVLALGNQVTPLQRVVRETPAKVGDITGNLAIVSQDAQAIIQELLRIESEAAQLYNLYASTQNSLRQQIRERIYLPKTRTYEEMFVENTRLDDSRGYVDYNAGAASLTLISETPIIPVGISIGVSSDPLGVVTSPLENMLDGSDETSMVFTGGQLELLFQFAQPEIINRIEINLDTYDGLTILELSSSPDGIYRENILADLPADQRVLDGSAGKFSGDFIALFNARHMKQIKLIVEDRVNVQQIAIRNIAFAARQYASSGTLTTTRITTPTGTVLFTPEQQLTSQLTSISHQISYDSVHFQGLTANQQLDVGAGPFWYRAYFERLDSNFDLLSSPVNSPGSDPLNSINYTIGNIQTVNLGAGLIERTINLEQISGPLVLEETPILETLTVFNGLATVPATQYTVNGNTITFGAPQSGITLRYQTSAYAQAGLGLRKGYYTPLLYSVLFTQVL